MIRVIYISNFFNIFIFCFNDYFNYQSKQERLAQNKSHQNEFIMDIIDSIGVKNQHYKALSNLVKNFLFDFMKENDELKE